MVAHAFLLLSAHHPLRAQVEQDIRRSYAEAHGARLKSFPRWLIGLIDDGNKICCAAGIRTADEGFFSECYLHLPLLERLGQISECGSGHVLEITTFAAFRPGVARALFGRLVDFCLATGADWAVFTATAPLRRLLASAYLPLELLAPASRDRVADPESWGSYYECDPWVCAIDRRSLAVRAHTCVPAALPKPADEIREADLGNV